MDSTFSFVIVTELTTSDDNGAIALTKKLSWMQMLKTKFSTNIRVRRITFVYEPRVGDLGRGEVTAEILDNRIDTDFSPNVLKTITFDVRQRAVLTWEHNVQLSIMDLKNPEQEPLVMKTTVSGCNLKENFSLGQIRVKVEIATYAKMLPMIRAKPATASLSPLLGKSTDRSLSFRVKGTAEEKPVARLKSRSVRYQLAEN